MHVRRARRRSRSPRCCRSRRPGPTTRCSPSAGTRRPPHHGYVDGYGNRCERFTIPAGRVADRVRRRGRGRRAARPDRARHRRRRRSMALPDRDIAYVLPSRFCLPDELGHEAWQRFGALDAGLGAGAGDRRLRARPPGVGARHVEPVDHGGRRLRAGQGVCRDFAHLAITLLPRAEHPGPLRRSATSRTIDVPLAGRADGLRRLVRGATSTGAGTPSTRATTAAASAGSSSAAAATRSTSR